MLDRLDEKTATTLRVVVPTFVLGLVSLVCRMTMTAASGRGTVVCGLDDFALLVAISGLIVIGGAYLASRSVMTLGFGLAMMLMAFAYLPDATEAALHFGRGYGYADAKLATIDHWLGFDWMAYARWMDGHPHLWTIGRYAYLSMPLLPLAVIVTLSLGEATVRLAAYFVLQLLCLSLVAGIAVFVPALGAFDYYRAADALFAHRDFVTAAHMTRSLAWLRQAALVGDGVDYHGLVSFPSYHAMSCMMNAWAMWSNRWTRWPMAALSLLILVATPVQGSHYLIDIIAGIAIAALAIKPSMRLVRWLSARRASPIPSPTLVPA